MVLRSNRDKARARLAARCEKIPEIEIEGNDDLIVLCREVENLVVIQVKQTLLDEGRYLVLMLAKLSNRRGRDPDIGQEPQAEAAGSGWISSLARKAA